MSSAEKVSVIIPSFNRVDDLLACLDSVCKSDYPNLEILIVDNASTDDTAVKVGQACSIDKRVRLIVSDKNLGAGGGRNLGAKEASGQYFLFLDSDNVVNPKMIGLLIDFFRENHDCGMVGPLMLIKKNPDVIWLYFADMNMFSSKAVYKGYGEQDKKQYEEIAEVGHLPNCFMVRRDDFQKVGGFDEKYFIMYEEADLAHQIRKQLGKKIYLISRAVTYHDFPLHDPEVQNNLGLRSSERAYLTARNRVYFMRKNASWFNFVVFFFVFNPLILSYYEILLLKNRQFAKAGAYLKGCLAGFFL